jgi:hypothetical protein
MPSDPVDAWYNFPVQQNDFSDIQLGIQQAALVGWVVYRDQFGKHHRNGYARQFNPPAPGTSNNLMFVNLPGYNYDEDLD